MNSFRSGLTNMALLTYLDDFNCFIKNFKTHSPDLQLKHFKLRAKRSYECTHKVPRNNNANRRN